MFYLEQIMFKFGAREVDTNAWKQKSVENMCRGGWGSVIEAGPPFHLSNLLLGFLPNNHTFITFQFIRNMGEGGHL